MPSLAQSIGHRVTIARIQADMTQAQLAQALGLRNGVAFISRLENGLSEVRLGKLIQIAGALNVPVEELLPV